MRVGRPRGFCMETALDSALTVFWKKGYEGTSLPDLTAAMGINRPSLYAAFGNKEALFMKALDRYDQKNACLSDVLESSPVKTAMENFMVKIVDRITCPDTPTGCLAVSGALSCSEETDTIKTELASRRERGQLAMHARFERAQKEGELPDKVDAAALARYYSTVLQGMSVQASGGATCEELYHVARTAMLVWPVI